MKLPGHRPALPGNVVSFYIVPLDPVNRAGLPGHIPANSDQPPHLIPPPPAGGGEEEGGTFQSSM
jgi:hypothetical protein